MDWHQRWYGDNPSLHHKFVTNGLVFGALASLYGIFVNFIASEYWWRFGSYLSFFLTALLSGATYWGMYAGRMKSQAGTTIGKRVLGIVAIPLFLFGMLWMLVVRVIPDAFTRVVGSSVQITAPMRAVHRSSRRICDYKLEGAVLDRAFPGHLCTRQSAFPSFPSDVSIILQGKETIFGVHIQRYFESSAAEEALAEGVAGAARR